MGGVFGEGGACRLPKEPLFFAYFVLFGKLLVEVLMQPFLAQDACLWVVVALSVMTLCSCAVGFVALWAHAWGRRSDQRVGADARHLFAQLSLIGSFGLFCFSNGLRGSPGTWETRPIFLGVLCLLFCVHRVYYLPDIFTLKPSSVD